MNQILRSSQIANSNDGILALTTNLQSSAPTILIEKLRNASKRYQNGDWNGAIRFYNEAIKLDQSNHILYGNRSILFTRIGKFEKALQDAIKARELCPDWSKAFYLQGVALQVEVFPFSFFLLRPINTNRDCFHSFFDAIKMHWLRLLLAWHKNRNL